MPYLSRIIYFYGFSKINKVLSFDFNNEERYINQVFNSQLPVSAVKPEFANHVFETQSYC